MIMTRHYYTLFNLAALSLIIFFGTNTFYDMVRSRLTQVQTDSVLVRHPQSAEPYQKKPLSAFRIITDRNLFGSSEKPTETVKEEDLEDLEPTSLNLTLLGTASGDDQSACAVIEEAGTRKQGLYKVGDGIQDAVVKKILRERVVLRVGEKDEILTMEEPTSDADEKTRPPVHITRQSSRQPARATTITVRRSDIEEALEDINQVLTQARIQPHFRDGRADGLSISRIRRGSIFSRMGLRNGDIIQAVNGNALNSPEDVFALYETLKSGTRASVQITRRGRQRSLIYQFK